MKNRYSALSAARRFCRAQRDAMIQRKTTRVLAAGLGALVLIAHVASTQAATIARWDFNSSPPDADVATGSLVPSIGSGAAQLVGGVTASFTAPNGSSDTNVTDNSNWRITTWPAQGTQNKSNGVQFKVNTAGFRNLSLKWDLRTSNTASKYTRLQYSTNGSDFLDYQVIVMPFETWMNGQTASFVGVPGADDNPRFTVRFVTEFESTAAGGGTAGYVPCNSTNNYGSAGTLRFDMVTFSGQSVLTGFTVMTCNILGNGATNWTLASTNLEALGRELNYVKPDVVGFQEIPETFYPQWTNFINAWLPGYQVVIGQQRLDGGERSGVASRFGIRRSNSWLARTDLTAFGYAGVFTRDLFEAEIVMPGFPQPFHFFTTHLKAHPDQDSAERRGAESRCVSNFFAKAYLTTNALHPYLLVGDMNEDIERPRTYEQGAIQNLTSAATGLRLTKPRNPVTNDERTWSIQNASLTIRFDYVLPGEILFSNITSSQVFRSDKVIPAVPPLLAGDSATAADHCPVLMTFGNPYGHPFRIRPIVMTNQSAWLSWESTPGGRYRIEGTTNFLQWSAIFSNIVAVDWQSSVAIGLTSARQFLRVARED